MRLPSVPGPRDVWQLLERSAESVEQLLAAVPRMIALLDQAERLVERTSVLLEDIERTRAGADAVVRRTDQVVDRSEDLLVTLVPLNDRMATLLDALEPPLTGLQPVLQRLADTTSPAEVDAMVHLVDQLPGLADKLQAEIVPILDSLETVAPDLHDLLDVSRELNEMLGQIPGLRSLKKRVEEQQEEEGRG